jgi:hypothetical protein
LDAEIVERDPQIRKLLEKFVCVRIVHANGMDLSLFQFDYDQSFAAFLMNADKTLYGRYGTRSHQTESADDVTLEGFAAALEAALAIHAEYPHNEPALTGKQPTRAPAYPVPEEFPPLAGQYDSKIAYEGQVAKSCIHCHQVGEVQRDMLWSAGEPITNELLFPYPHPKALGLIMDPREAATIKSVEPNSSAARDGFEQGDKLLSLAGQPLLSMADIQWVLNNAPAEGRLPAELLRDGRKKSLELTLASGWRTQDNISWRASSWALRRMTTGGLLLEETAPSARRAASLADDALALTVRHVGEYGAHALAKQAGFKKGDILVSVDGRTDAMRETDLFAFLVQNKRIGDEYPVTVLRDGQRLDLKLRVQE